MDAILLRVTMNKIILLLLILCVSVANAAQVIDERLIPTTVPRNSQLIPTGETNAVCVGNTPGPTPALTLCSTLDLTGKTVLFKLPEYTIANLPATHPLSIITNGSASDDCTKGGGTTRVLCAWNGSAWASIGGGGAGTGDLTEVQGTSNEICVTSGTGPIPVLQLCSTIVTDGKTLRVGRFEMTGDITPAALGGTTQDWNPTGLSAASTVRASATSNINLGGLQTGSDGRVITIHNIGTIYFITLLHEASASTASNRFSLGADLPLGPQQAVMLQYDATDFRWRALGAPYSPATADYCADSGGTDAYACNLVPAINTYTVGRRYSFKANTANTTAATLQLNSIPTPVTIKKVLGGVTTDLETNDIRVGQIVQVVYDGTNFQMQSMLGNSPTGISALTTGCIPKAASATTINDSSLCEDADSINISKSLEVGSVASNSWKIQGTGVTGNVVAEFQTLRKKTITFRIGSDSGDALVDAQDEMDVWENQIGAMHITSVKCQTNGNSGEQSTINLQRDDGSPADILSSNLVCTNAGATSTSFTSGEDAISVGHKISFVMVTAATAGSPKRLTITITAMLDSGA